MHYDTLEQAKRAVWLLPDMKFLKIFHPALYPGGPFSPPVMDMLRMNTAEAVTEEYTSGMAKHREEQRAAWAAAGED